MSLVWSLIVPDGAFTRTMAFLLAGATLAIGVVTSEAPRRTRHAVAAALVVLVAAGILFDAVGSPGPAAILAATALLSAATIAVMPAASSASSSPAGSSCRPCSARSRSTCSSG